MEKILKTQALQIEYGTVVPEESLYVLKCEALKGARASYAQEDIAEYFKGADYIYLDITARKAPYSSPVIQFEFWQEGNDTREPDLTVRLSCLPQISTCLVVPLTALDAQNIFLARTPGRLRGFVTGCSVSKEKISKFAVGLREYWSEQEVAFGELHFSDKMPEIKLEPVKLVDELGQWMQREWEGKTKGMDKMIAGLRNQQKDAIREKAAGNQEEHSYGGWPGLRFEKSGYFALEEYKGKFLLKDPEGYGFFSTGVDVVSPEINCPVEQIENYFSWLPERNGVFGDAWESFGGMDQVNFLKLNLIRAFGTEWEEAWKNIITSFLKQWGFNTIGNFSKLPAMGEANIPYVCHLKDFPGTKQLIYRDFPDVFSEEYEENAARYAKQLENYREDRFVIGYFMRNEPEWAFAEELEIAAELLKNPCRTLKTKERFIDYLKQQYSGIEEINKDWGMAWDSFEDFKNPVAVEVLVSPAAKKHLTAFSYEMIKQYVKVPALALKKVDPNHLNLGMRYAFILYPNQCAGKEYMDVFSINCYKVDPGQVLQEVTSLTKMPVLIGEFHFGSIDKGLGSTGIVGVASQKDRAMAYQRYIEACTQNRYCIGAHWFQLYDQHCMGRMDGENYQIGLLDVCNRPYEEFIEGVKYTHDSMYLLCTGRMQPEKPEPELAKSNIAS